MNTVDQVDASELRPGDVVTQIAYPDRLYLIVAESQHGIGRYLNKQTPHKGGAFAVMLSRGKSGYGFTGMMDILYAKWVRVATSDLLPDFEQED